jgi:hypothetical protein
MELAESGSIEWSPLKGEVRRFFEKLVRPPSCKSPLKIQRHLVQLLAIKILIAKRVHSSICGLSLLHTVVGNGDKNNLKAVTNVFFL